MIITDVQDKIREVVSENASTILTAAGVVGTVATAVLAGRAGVKAGRILAEMELNQPADEPVETKDKVIAVAPQFIPPVLTGSATIASVIMANRMSAQKAAAMAALYGLSQKQFEEYKAKVAEKLTGGKQTQVKDELAQERVNRAPGGSQIIVVGDDVLCFDQPTGRYFKSSMEKINRAVVSVNQEIINHGCARASQFYDELELEPTTWANDVGWNLDNTLELDITTTQDDSGRPCLSLNFSRFPIEDYQRSLY